jgi:DNA-binding transcriptional MerR regulator
MRIGDLTHATGVTAQTIRYYERRGLLPSATREQNGYRQYDDATAARLRFIRSAQTAGLTLTEISSITALREAGEVPCEHVSALLDSKLNEVRARQHELALLETELQQLIDASRNLDPANCPQGSVCQIIPSAPRNDPS